MFKRARRFVLPTLLLLTLATMPLLAQATTGTVRGVVVDKDGEPLPGVTITFENPSTGVTGLGAVTNPQGEYRITNVPVGSGYVLRIALVGFQKIEVPDLEIRPGRALIQNITLRPEMTERIRVQGTTETVDTESTTISTTISSEFISGLPVLGRDYQDVLTLAPGVTDVNDTGNPNIHGARDTDVVTLVDGVSTTDPFSGQFGQDLNSESIEEIEVITSGASAEFGRAQGGFVKISTKSGGNEFKGSFTFSMRTQKLDGDGAGIDASEVRGGIGESDGFRNLDFMDLQPFLSVSGAFIKDKLWYYFAPQYSQVELPVNAGSLAFVQRTISKRATGKVTWQASSNNKVSFNVLWDDTQFDNQGLNSLISLESGFTFERGGPTLTLQDTWILSPTVSLETTVSRFDQDFARVPTTPADTNGNGILTIDEFPTLGGNQDGFINLRERDPGEDYDRDGRYDVFEDFDRNFTLGGCTSDPITGQRTCTEDRDMDGRLTFPGGCEGDEHEDINCNGRIDFETDQGEVGFEPYEDANNNGILDPGEDLDGNGKLGLDDRGIPCIHPVLCPNGYLPGTRNNGIVDNEDVNGNSQLDVIGEEGNTPFPFWNDRNGNGIPEPGEFKSPRSPDDRYEFSFNTNRTQGPNNREWEDTRTRNTLREDVSWYVDDFFGSHDIKMGFAFEDEGFDRTTQLRPFWAIRAGAINPNNGQIGGTISATLPTQEIVSNQADSENIAFYIDDTFKPLPNLTLRLGVRFEREKVNSLGFTFFEPATQRAQFDLLQALKGIEVGAGDLNLDGVLTQSLASDPIHGPGSPRVASLNSTLGTISPGRFTRHNFEDVDIQSDQFTESGFSAQDLLNGIPRQPESFTITNNNIAPRLSVSWDPWGDGKSKATAGWNRYYDKLFLASVINEEGPDTFNPYYAYDADGTDLGGIPNNQVGRLISFAPPNAAQVDRGLETPFTDEITLGFQREIAPEVSVSVNYIKRKFRAQLQDIDVNHSIRTEDQGTCDADGFHTLSGLCDILGRVQVPPASGNGGEAGKSREQRGPDSYPDLYINNFNFNQILRVGNYNSQEYTGYELVLNRRLSRKWTMTASYVFSKSRGQAENFLGESGDDPALTELKSGYLNFDQRHVAKFNAVTYLPGDWQFGGGITWSSGLPWSAVNRFRAIDNVDYPQFRRLYGYQDPNSGKFIEEERNIHRNPAVYDFSARVQKNFVMGQISAGAFFEIFDILNSDDLRVFEIDNSFANLQSAQVREFGRRFQFGISMDF